MRFDQFENKVKEAADNHHPAYDELAWRKMRKLLDEHMPEKEKKRRFLFLIPLFFLLGGGTWLALEYSGKRQVISNPAETISTGKPGTTSQEHETRTNLNLIEISPVPAESEPPVLFVKRTVNNDYLRIAGKDPQTRETTTISSAQPETGIGVLNPERVSHTERTGETVGSEPLSSSPNPETRNEPVLHSDKQPNEQVNSQSTQKNGETSGSKRKRSPNRFFFFVSLGADASFIKEMGETRLMPGVGVGFLIRDKITIRSGLFSARKVYSAKPSEYDLPPNVLSYYPNLRRIDAECDVLELPLMVSYQFGRSSKQKWMATAGISSIFMKKEKYNYHFKPTPGSPEITRSYTLRNESIHHYSIATLSMGYKRKLGKSVSLTAEPYIKMPLKGVGLGKVKLHSGGVMFTVGISPFGK